MTSSPKRPWFRFHLLTAVVTVVVIGGLIGANVTESPVFVSHGNPLLTGMGWPCIWKVYAHGECRDWFTPADEAAEAAGPTMYAVRRTKMGSTSIANCEARSEWLSKLHARGR